MTSVQADEYVEEQASPWVWWRNFKGDFGGGGFPINSTSIALEASRVVKSGAGILFGFQGINNGAQQFVQVHNARSVPADGAIPEIIIVVAAASNFSFGLSGPWRAFDQGIILCNSSTLATKTIGSANCWFDVQYV